MKINLFVKYLDDKTGGEKIAYYFAEYLYKQKVPFTVYCGKIKTSNVPIFTENVKELGLVGLNRFTKYFSFHRKCDKIVKNSGDISFAFDRIVGCDIYRNGSGLHTDYLKTSIEHYPTSQKLLKKFKRTLAPINYYLKKVEDKLYESKKLGYVIVNSELIKTTLTNKFPFLEEKIEVVHNGIDKDKFNFDITLNKRNELKKQYKLYDSFVIGHASNNFERKGLRFIIQALAKLPEKFILVVAGSGSTGYYKELSKKCGVSDRVFFLGKIDDMTEFYPMLDLFCLPALYDPFPNVVPESLGMGIPVLCSKHIGSFEIIKNNKNGMVLNTISAEEIAISVKDCSKIRVQNFSQNVPGLNDMYDEYLKIIEKVSEDKR
ncbi:glycosyl transferase group 1 [Flexistipes sinusarabici DSM 4947]|uniref:Glycosyl transferase group 1 n=1 Tax=Flexistipes sinusarabici (strain ATCC 49648 / DSM 4947 / MAS 10) TaxID=717231 RepID=F8E827_FLESM|nr:glycosyltransferase family 4 protein [Flexistipes sinusarabici]AEI13951.1 glycosyl transferase group 1 [Flexistipes sinusarabici DSM 4947]